VGVEPPSVTLFEVLTKRATGGAGLPGQATDDELLAWAATLAWDPAPDDHDLGPPAEVAVVEVAVAEVRTVEVTTAAEAGAPVTPPAPGPHRSRSARSGPTASPVPRRTLRARPLVAAPADRLD
jgi:hypothetical protein